MSALSGPEAAVSGPAAFSFSAAADSTFRRFECRVPGLRDAWTTCSTGIQEDPPSGTWQFEVRAVDWSNNRSPASSWAWEVDKQEPDTTLTGGPSGAVASSAATFTFDSSHSFEVWARDELGHVDPTPAERTWTVDTLAPDTTILPGPPAETTATSAAIEFEASEPPGGFRCQLDLDALAPCSSPYTASGLAVGPHTLRVWARDALGNEDATPAEIAWTVKAEPDPPPDPDPDPPPE